MTSDIPLTLQTAYADLLDRCAFGAFETAFADDGVFTPKTVRGRIYWYFQATERTGGRKQRYVGPETPELLERIRQHRQVRGDQKDRRALVSALIRSAHLPRPVSEIGKVVEALARAGVFRRRGVLVGTIAYQTFSGMLGIRLARSQTQTGDVDFAQFKSVSVAIEEVAPSVLDALKQVDPSFRPIPHRSDSRRASTYAAGKGLRVDFLTPNQGPDTDAPLPGLGADAQQLRFLDFLIHEPEPAVVLYGEGVYVHVPSPQRYAVHKLIVSRLREEGAAKRDKDSVQAEALLDVLAAKRPHELRAVWQEAFERGRKWRRYLGEGLGLIAPETRDRTLKAVGAVRGVVPGLDLAFAAPRARFDPDREIVEFSGTADDHRVRCAITRAALEDHFGLTGAGRDAHLDVFRAHRTTIERMMRMKYLTRPVEDGSEVLLTSDDVEELQAPPR